MHCLADNNKKIFVLLEVLMLVWPGVTNNEDKKENICLLFGKSNNNENIFATQYSVLYKRFVTENNILDIYEVIQAFKHVFKYHKAICTKRTTTN